MKIFSGSGGRGLFALLISLAFLVERGVAQGEGQAEHLVSIFAHGEGKVAADSVVVALMLRSEDSQLAVAVNRSLTKKEALKKSFRGIGIAEKDIVFDNFSSDSETGRFTGKVKSYTVSSPIRVTVRDERQFAAVSLEIDKDNDLEYRGRTAKVSDKSAPQLKAAEDSVANLNKKVKLYESAFGVKLELVSFEELLAGQTLAPMTAVTGGYSASKGLRSAGYSVNDEAIDGLIAAVEGGASFGDLKASVNVHGLFRIVREEAGDNAEAKPEQTAQVER